MNQSSEAMADGTDLRPKLRSPAADTAHWWRLTAVTSAVLMWIACADKDNATRCRALFFQDSLATEELVFRKLLASSGNPDTSPPRTVPPRPSEMRWHEENCFQGRARR